MSAIDTQLAEIRDRHNAKLAELQAFAPKPGDGEDAAQWNSDLDALHAEVQDLKAQYDRASARKLTEMEPIAADAVPLAMTEAGEKQLKMEEALAHDPVGYWMSHPDELGIPPEDRRGDQFTFTLKGGADVLLGRPRFRMGVDGSGVANGIQFADPVVSTETQDTIPGLGMAPPTQAPSSFLDVIAQVQTPMAARDVRFLRGDIATDIGAPTQDGVAIGRIQINFAEETRKLQTVGAITGLSRPAMKANSEFLPWLEGFMGRMVGRRASMQAVAGDGQTTGNNTNFHGLASETLDNNEIAMDANAATNFLTGVGTAHDAIVYEQGGMATHVIARHEACATIRNTPNDEAAWRSVEFFRNNPMLGFMGMLIVPTAELPPYGTTSRVAYVGDFSPDERLPRPPVGH